VHHAMGILQYKGKVTFQDQEWNKTSVDKIKELHQVVDMAFKPQERITGMPGRIPMRMRSRSGLTRSTAHLNTFCGKYVATHTTCSR